MFSGARSNGAMESRRSDSNDSCAVKWFHRASGTSSDGTGRGSRLITNESLATSRMNPKRIGLIGFDRVTALHLIAPAEAFCAATLDDGYGGRIPCYEVCTIGVHADRFRTESGLTLQAETTLADTGEFDTIIVAGGAGIRERHVADAVASFLLK